MKTDLQRTIRSAWLVLSEVPGWPDAPRSVRFRRVMPIIIPCVLALGIGVWKELSVDARRDELRATHAPLLALEREIEELGFACSDGQAAELAARAIEAGGRLLPSPTDATAHLRPMAGELRALGWDANVQIFDSGAEPEEDAFVAFAPVRVRMSPLPTNDAPFPTLLTALEKLVGTGKRIDLTRLVVRADEEGKRVVEANLRVAARLPHEKASE